MKNMTPALPQKHATFATFAFEKPKATVMEPETYYLW